MLTKVLRLSPITPEFEAECLLTNKQARVFNLEKLEFFHYHNDYYLNTEAERIALEEGDEILLGSALLKVSFLYQEEEDEAYDWIGDIGSPEEFFPYKENHKDLTKDHPLGFLFNQPSWKEHD